MCLYADTTDGHFLIARDPAREGLVVASGDSGHSRGGTATALHKFCRRPGLYVARSQEAARFQG